MENNRQGTILAEYANAYCRVCKITKSETLHESIEDGIELGSMAADGAA